MPLGTVHNPMSSLVLLRSVKACPVACTMEGTASAHACDRLHAKPVTCVRDATQRNQINLMRLLIVPCVDLDIRTSRLWIESFTSI